ncbi:MAG: methionyl-tRNA formyltransferase, partial [Nevskiaceae bacterium]
HELAAVYSRPDRPAGRGRAVQAAPVAQRAAALELPLRQPAQFTAEAVEGLRQLAVDALVVVAYGLILPAGALAAPRLGCFNIHASLLPRWRGAAPIQRAILAGDRETGVTIMRMDAGLDTGPMVLREAVLIGAETTAAELHDALAPLGARLIVHALEDVARGTARETPQPAEGVTYAKKVSKDEARLDWSRPAVELARAVRAYNPAPVAWSELDPGSGSAAGGERVRLWRAHAEGTAGGSPGAILAAGAEGIRVATGSGTLVVTELQFPGGKPLTAQQAATGRTLTGRRFG